MTARAQGRILHARFSERDELNPLARCCTIAAHPEPTLLLYGDGLLIPMKYRPVVLPNGKPMVHAVAYTYAEVLEEMWKSYKEVAGPLPTPCWVWTKKRFHRGYGDICYQRKHRQVHRFAWESLHGPIPKGLLICHKCDNPPCFRPDHLFLGTNRDNVLDCLIKSRFSRVKLAPQDVAEIRNAYANGVASQGQLSKRFGVSQWHIWGIIHGRFWKHLLDPMP